MPNWCHNRLVVSGPAVELDRFAHAASGEDEEGNPRPLSLARLVPEPEGLTERQEDLESSKKLFDRLSAAKVPDGGDRETRRRRLKEILEGLTDGEGVLGSLVVDFATAAGIEIPDERLNWYSWRVRHWGTKWDLVFEADGVLALAPAEGDGEDADVSISDGSALRVGDQLIYGFLSAWSPPVPALHKIADDYPQLTFVLRYAEVGNDFAGELRICRAEGLAEEEQLSVEDVLSPEERWF